MPRAAGRIREAQRGRTEGSKVGALAQALAEALEVAVEEERIADRPHEAAPKVLARLKAAAGPKPIR